MAETLDRMSPDVSNEFAYRPVPPLAVATFGAGLFSLIGIMVEFALPIAILGILFGFMAARQIRRADGDYSGGGITKIGIVLCVLCLVGGSVRLAYAIATEVPDGFRRVNFTRDISKKGFVFRDGVNEYHGDVKALDGQKLFIKGYMYPSGQMQGLREFILCRDSGECCFGGEPKLTDMIRVRVPDDGHAVNYYAGLVAVAGDFRLNDLRRVGNLQPAYELDITHFNPAKSLY
jgi:hypothetical protein